MKERGDGGRERQRENEEQGKETTERKKGRIWEGINGTEKKLKEKG